MSEALTPKKLTGFGQIKQGAKLLINNIPQKAERVIRGGTADEEIIISVHGNSYFITSLYLNNKSWAKEVYYYDQKS